MARKFLKHSTDALLDIILPPASFETDVKAGLIWQNITFLDEPCCDLCGYPFEYNQGEGIICGSCAAKPPAYHKGRSAFAYDEASRDLVLAFKHGGHTHNLHMFAQQLKRAGRNFWADTDFIIPVPLHHERLRERRFNQAALLAKALSSHVDASFEAGMLFRYRATESQGLQTPAGRYRNVKGAFRVPDKARLKLQGRNVVLIDDVITTGATLEACAKTLIRVGAKKVNVVTLSRVVRPQTPLT